MARTPLAAFFNIPLLELSPFPLLPGMHKPTMEDNFWSPLSVDLHFLNKEVDHANLYFIFFVDGARCS